MRSVSQLAGPPTAEVGVDLVPLEQGQHVSQQLGRVSVLAAGAEGEVAGHLTRQAGQDG